MATYITFQGGNGGGGGGGGTTNGGGSPALSPGTNTGSGRNSSQGNHAEPMLFIRRDHLNIDLGPLAMEGNDGYLATIPTTQLPRRIYLTANCYYFISHDKPCKFAFIIDVLLVPLSFDVRKCSDLYLEPFNPHSQSWYVGTRRLRDNIIRLRRFVVRGEDMTYDVEQCDIPEDIRNRQDYRLAVTCPVYGFFYQPDLDVKSHLYVQVEMEF